LLIYLRHPYLHCLCATVELINPVAIPNIVVIRKILYLFFHPGDYSYIDIKNMRFSIIVASLCVVASAILVMAGLPLYNNDNERQQVLDIGKYFITIRIVIVAAQV
jgi:hypothetical protein